MTKRVRYFHTCIRGHACVNPDQGNLCQNDFELNKSHHFKKVCTMCLAAEEKQAITDKSMIHKWLSGRIGATPTNQERNFYYHLR